MNLSIPIRRNYETPRRLRSSWTAVERPPRVPTSVREGARAANLRAKASTTITSSTAARFFGIRDSSSECCRRPLDFPAAAFFPSAELKSDLFEEPCDYSTYIRGQKQAEEICTYEHLGRAR